MDGENCDPMNLYRWLEGAHVKNLEIDPRLLCTGQKWSYLCSLLVRFCLLRSPFRDAVLCKDIRKFSKSGTCLNDVNILAPHLIHQLHVCLIVGEFLQQNLARPDTHFSCNQLCQFWNNTGCPAKLFLLGYLLFCRLILMQIAKVGSFMKNSGN